MRRLKAILAPVAPSGGRARLVITGLGVVIAAVAGAGSLAVAAQREPVMVAGLTPVPAAVPTPPLAPVAVIAAAPAVEPATATPEAPTRLEAAPEPPTRPVQAADPVAASVITNPTWAQHPMPQFPAAAFSAGVTNGRVVVTCTAEADGRLSDCSVVSETPAGAGFAEAAIEASRAARLSPGAIDSVAARSKVTFAVSFRIAP